MRVDYYQRWSSDIFSPPAPFSFQRLAERTNQLEEYVRQFEQAHSTRNAPNDPKP